MDAEQTGGKIFYIMGSINGGSSPERLPVEFSNSSSHSSWKMLPQCCCRLVTNSQLSSCFLGYCITLMIFRCTEVPKPNLAGSKSLIQSIFGISDEDASAPSMPLSYSKGFCLIRSTCLGTALFHHQIKMPWKIQTQCLRTNNFV